MKTVALIIATLIIGVINSVAQTTTTKSSSSSSSLSITVDNDENTSETYYRSYVFLDLDSRFKIKIKFMKDRINTVKSYLIDQFGKDNAVIENETYLWKKKFNGELLYEVKLKQNKVKITFDKEIGSHKEIERFKNIGEELKLITSKHQSVN